MVAEIPALIFTGSMALLLCITYIASKIVAQKARESAIEEVEEQTKTKTIHPIQSNQFGIDNQDTVSIPSISLNSNSNNNYKEVKMINEEEPKGGLKSMLSEILENQRGLTEEKKISRWKLPWKARISERKAQKGWATIQVIKDNGEVEFVKIEIKDGTVKIDNFPRVATIDYKLSHKGKPFYIIPSWSMKPFSAVENYSNTEKEKMNIAGRRSVLAVLETQQIKTKKDFGSMWWIILAAVVIGAIYYFGKNSGWF